MSKGLDSLSSEKRDSAWRPVALWVVVIALVIALSWRFGATLLAPEIQVLVEPPSLYPPPTAEPIAPIPRSLPLDRQKVALGERLFRDLRLSRDNRVACASCHQLSKGGADGLRYSVGFGGQPGDVNAPTVFNSGFNFRQFWNGRAQSLEEQIEGPVHNPKEMASSWPEILAKLGQDARYRAGFAALYREGITPANIKDAIATFERSLVTPNSRFDRYLRGERDALSRSEAEGYRLFRSYGCISCHQGINLGGNLFERLGVARAYFDPSGNFQPADRGRFALTGKPEDLHVFKVPGLRNVALTAPYFHDGSVPTLEEAVRIMGKYQLGIVIPPGDVERIVEFLHTLTGEFRGTPL